MKEENEVNSNGTVFSLLLTLLLFFHQTKSYDEIQKILKDKEFSTVEGYIQGCQTTLRKESFFAKNIYFEYSDYNTEFYA